MNIDQFWWLDSRLFVKIYLFTVSTQFLITILFHIRYIRQILHILQIKCIRYTLYFVDPAYNAKNIVHSVICIFPFFANKLLPFMKKRIQRKNILNLPYYFSHMGYQPFFFFSFSFFVIYCLLRGGKKEMYMNRTQYFFLYNFTAAA